MPEPKKKQILQIKIYCLLTATIVVRIKTISIECHASQDVKSSTINQITFFSF